MQHVEFFHNDHFEDDYFRVKPSKNLKKFIDFFWETDFDHLYDLYPQGFSDALFPNIGYTYLINLGTPFIMQLGDAPFHVKTDGFLPRHQNIECHHSSGNKIFGIKFKVSPVLFQKKVDFSEYKEYIFPLAYLIDRHVVEKVKRAADFQSRVAIITEYYEKILQEYSGTTKHVDIVASILNDCFEKNNFDISIEDLAGEHGISSRSLQRYFEATTSLSSKKVLQIMRIRKAVAELILDPVKFNFANYGYYDYSHFSKHMKQFLGKFSRPELTKKINFSQAGFDQEQQ